MPPFPGIAKICDTYAWMTDTNISSQSALLGVCSVGTYEAHLLFVIFAQQKYLTHRRRLAEFPTYRMFTSSASNDSYSWTTHWGYFVNQISTWTSSPIYYCIYWERGWERRRFVARYPPKDCQENFETMYRIRTRCFSDCEKRIPLVDSHIYYDELIMFKGYRGVIRWLGLLCFIRDVSR